LEVILVVAMKMMAAMVMLRNWFITGVAPKLAKKTKKDSSESLRTKNDYGAMSTVLRASIRSS